MYFSRHGRLERHGLGLDDTPANRKHAARTVERIKAQIKAGVYDPGEYWESHSNRATLAEYCSRWLGLQAHLADSTLSGYTSTLTAMLIPRLGHLPIDNITPSQLGLAFEQHGWKSAKARNNALTPVRGVFELALRDRIIPSNPADLLRAAKVQNPEPDPLTLDEVNAVVEWFGAHRDDQTANYFEFAFFTGLRTSELIALEWRDVDLRRRTIRVQRATVNGKAKAQTKTAKARDVDLTERAYAALIRQKARTYLAGGVIFLDPITGRRYVDDKPPRMQWNAALKGLGMRHRVAYQTRHTFATLALMAGANPMWVSRQLGHSTMQMTLSRYSRWIDQADQRREVGKMDAAVGKVAGKEPGKTGTT